MRAAAPPRSRTGTSARSRTRAGRRIACTTVRRSRAYSLDEAERHLDPARRCARLCGRDDRHAGAAEPARRLAHVGLRRRRGARCLHGRAWRHGARLGGFDARLRRRACRVVALCVFSLASVGCALAGGIAFCSSARAVQGFGGAVVLAVAGAALAPRVRSRLGAPRRAEPPVGPVVGGALTQAFSGARSSSPRRRFRSLRPCCGRRGSVRRRSRTGAARRAPDPRARPGLRRADRAPVRRRPAARRRLGDAPALRGARRQLVRSRRSPARSCAATRDAGRFGSGLIGGGIAALAFLPTDNVAWLIVPECIAGFGMGLALTPLIEDVASGAHDAASALNLAVRHLGVTLALVVLAPVIQHDLDARGAREAAHRRRRAGCADRSAREVSLAPELVRRSTRPAARSRARGCSDARDVKRAERARFDAMFDRIETMFVAAARTRSDRVPDRGRARVRRRLAPRRRCARRRTRGDRRRRLRRRRASACGPLRGAAEVALGRRASRASFRTAAASEVWRRCWRCARSTRARAASTRRGKSSCSRSRTSRRANDSSGHGVDPSAAGRDPAADHRALMPPDGFLPARPSSNAVVMRGHVGVVALVRSLFAAGIAAGAIHAGRPATPPTTTVTRRRRRRRPTVTTTTTTVATTTTVPTTTAATTTPRRRRQAARPVGSCRACLSRRSRCWVAGFALLEPGVGRCARRVASCRA